MTFHTPEPDPAGCGDAIDRLVCAALLIVVAIVALAFWVGVQS